MTGRFNWNHPRYQRLCKRTEDVNGNDTPPEFSIRPRSLAQPKAEQRKEAEAALREFMAKKPSHQPPLQKVSIIPDDDDGEVSPADVPQKAAAVLLIASNYDRGGDDNFGDSATLDALRPFSTGQVREHADYAATNPDDEMRSMPFWSA
jgi:hypothetical protein